MSETVDRLLSCRETAEVLSVREGTLAAWRFRGTANRPQPVRVGTRRIAYRESEVLAYRDRETTVAAWSGDGKSSKKRGRK